MSGDEGLAKDLGLVSALAIDIGMMGAGIFVLLGVAARESGPNWVSVSQVRRRPVTFPTLSTFSTI